MNTRILILGPNFTFPVRLSKRIFSWYPVKNQLSICLRRHGWKETILNFNMRLIKILSIHNTSKQSFWRSFSQVTFFGFSNFWPVSLGSIWADDLDLRSILARHFKGPICSMIFDLWRQMDFELREILRKIKTPENPFCNIPKSTVVTLDRSPHKTSTKHDRQNYFDLKFTNIFEFTKLFKIQLGSGIRGHLISKCNLLSYSKKVNSTAFQKIR